MRIGRIRWWDDGLRHDVLDAAGANKPTEHRCVHLWVHLVWRGGRAFYPRTWEAQKSRLCTRRNPEDNTQGHTKESNTIWKDKTHNPRAGDSAHRNAFYGEVHSCLYVKFWRFQMCCYMNVSWCNLGSPSAEQLYKMSLLIEASLYLRLDLSHSVAGQDRLSLYTLYHEAHHLFSSFGIDLVSFRGKAVE